jgi:hypothetical protein
MSAGFLLSVTGPLPPLLMLRVVWESVITILQQ